MNKIITSTALGVMGLSVVVPATVNLDLQNKEKTQHNNSNRVISFLKNKHIKKPLRHHQYKIKKEYKITTKKIKKIRPKYKIAKKYIPSKNVHTDIKDKMKKILFKEKHVTKKLRHNIYKTESNFRYNVYSPSKHHAGVCQLNSYWGNTLAKKRGYKWRGIRTPKKVQDKVCMDRFNDVIRNQKSSPKYKIPVVNNLTVYLGHQQGINGAKQIIDWITGKNKTLKVSLVSTLFNNLPKSKQEQIKRNSKFKKPVLHYSKNRKKFRQYKKRYKREMNIYMTKIYKSYTSTIVYTWLKVYDKKMYA